MKLGWLLACLLCLLVVPLASGASADTQRSLDPDWHPEQMEAFFEKRMEERRYHEEARPTLVETDETDSANVTITLTLNFDYGTVATRLMDLANFVQELTTEISEVVECPQARIHIALNDVVKQSNTSITVTFAFMPEDDSEDSPEELASRFWQALNDEDSLFWRKTILSHTVDDSRSDNTFPDWGYKVIIISAAILIALIGFGLAASCATKDEEEDESTHQLLSGGAQEATDSKVGREISFFADETEDVAVAPVRHVSHDVESARPQPGQRHHPALTPVQEQKSNASIRFHFD